MPSPALLRGLLDTLYFSGLAHVTRRFFRGQGVIFCLHHVCPGGGRQLGFAPNAKLECEPEFLESLINLVRRRGYETVSLAEAVRRLVAGENKAQPFAVFTLDDGYVDNREYAKPVFDRLACPYTIFVAPRIAEGTCELWWRLLEQVISAHPTISFEMGDIAYSLPTDTIAGKWNAWNVLLPEFEGLGQFEQRNAIRSLCAKYQVNPDAYCRSVGLDWQALQQMAGDPLCTIGAHTLNHFAVGKMTQAECAEQLQASKAQIEKALGLEIKFNAYPYGDEPNAGPRDFRLAAQAGYAASLTTRKGVVFAGHANHLQALPRIMISGRFQKLRYVDALLSGLPTALLNRFRQINVA